MNFPSVVSQYVHTHTHTSSPENPMSVCPMCTIKVVLYGNNVVYIFDCGKLTSKFMCDRACICAFLSHQCTNARTNLGSHINIDVSQFPKLWEQTRRRSFGATLLLRSAGISAYKDIKIVQF